MRPKEVRTNINLSNHPLFCLHRTSEVLFTFSEGKAELIASALGSVAYLGHFS